MPKCNPCEPAYRSTATAEGEAFTSTTPQYKVTSTATSTATSEVSQQDADDSAQTVAQQVANSQAQNDANIITKSINISTTSVKGQYSDLNIYYATPTAIGSNSTFTGVILTPSVSSVFKTNSINITSVKQIYEINSISVDQPTPTKIIPNAYIKGTCNLTYENFIPPNPLPPKAPSGTKSILTGTRLTYVNIPINSKIYYITKATDVTIFCSKIIDETTTVNDINGSFLTVLVNNKMAHAISVSEGNKFNKYIGVTIIENYTNDSNFNYLCLNFDNASLVGSSENIYPKTVGEVAP